MALLREELVELSRHFKQERLFVTAERDHLLTLNKNVLKATEQLFHIAWIARQQRINLDGLVMSKQECTPTVCHRKANALENTNFIDAYKVLGTHERSYSELLQSLRENPELVAMCLSAGEKLSMELMQMMTVVFISSVYGNCILQEDEYYVLQVLRHLMELQLSTNETPRRLLRHGTCAFSRIYKLFTEGLFSTKLFLTAALHGPIMNLLMEDEYFLDIDPAKALVRFSAHDRLKKFGREGTPEYTTKLQKYRNWTISKLVTLTNRFITSIKSSLYCFPHSVSWLVRQMYNMLMKVGKVDEREVNAMCVDLVMAFFICPAIVNPEPYGIIQDAPVSYTARFNLIQVAQILQVLTMRKWEDIDVKLMDLYGRFDKDCMSSLVTAMLDGNVDDLSIESESSHNLQGLTRSAVLIAENQLSGIVVFLRDILNKSQNETLDRKCLESLLSSIPAELPRLAHNHVQNGSPVMSSVAPTGKKGLLGKVSKSRNKPNTTLQTEGEEGLDSIKLPVDDIPVAVEDVLVLPFHNTSNDYIGLLTEQKVLCLEMQNRQIRVRMNVESLPNHDEGHEKRTRFSLSHDEGSIGNTSDNLEAISEAASNHSVASSLELENEDQNDNLSDMVSANVSGRGTPNVSGRDTPSSQITEGGDERTGSDNRHTINVPKQTRSDIEDRFGKFEIKTLIEGECRPVRGDETVSLVSDTWSTDVLASDSETLEQTDRNDTSTTEDTSVRQLLDPGQSSAMLDISETASEAWSTDVLASDSERLGEFDTEDTASVARSDDTARSEDITRPEENCDPLQLDLPITMAESPLVISVQPPRSNATGFQPIHDERNRVNLGSVLQHFDPLVGKTGERQRKLSGESDRSHEKVNPVVSVQDNILISGASENKPVEGILKHSDARLGSTSDTVFTPALPEELTKLKDGDNVHLSTASLASSSSSGSSEAVIKSRSNSTASAGTSTSGNIPFDPTITEGSPLPTLSTGAIPKSISFDKTAERGDREWFEDDHRHKKSFFKGLKQSLIRRRKSGRGQHDDSPARVLGHERNQDMLKVDMDENLPSRMRRTLVDDIRGTSETSDDILNKYRKKPVPTVTESPLVTSGLPIHNTTKEEEDDRLVIDPTNVEASYAFADAKRKLRLVLSNSDSQTLPINAGYSFRYVDGLTNLRENELVAFLKVQLAEAISQQDRDLVAQLHEALRCVRLFDDKGCRKLFRSLKEDYKKRSPYIAYLIRCKQGLMNTLAHLQRLIRRIEQDQCVCSKSLTSVSVRLFLEKREEQLKSFESDFQQLAMSDEKIDLLEKFLQRLYDDMMVDDAWQAVSESQLCLAQLTVERSVMGRIYTHALYPNGDGDYSRDQVLHDHMKKLSKVVTPNHKDLRIAKVYHYECPWPSAQAEVVTINAFRTPKDKLACVLRTCSTIMNLLYMACESGTPAADDFIPVFVFVLIKANPPSLLSTVLLF